MNNSNNEKRQDLFWKYIKRKPRDLNVGEVFKKTDIIEAIKLMLEANKEFLSSYVNKKRLPGNSEIVETYYKVNVTSSERINSFDLIFDLYSIPHILGLADFKYILRDFEPISTIFDTKYENISINESVSKLYSTFFDIINKYSQKVIDHDSNEKYSDESKLNWIKIGYKAHCFLNLKMFNSNDWLIYREHRNYNKSNEESVLLVRNLYIDNIQYKLYFVCVKEEKKDGRYCFVPKSIMIKEITGQVKEYMNFIDISGVEYKRESSVVIKQVIDGQEQNYGSNQNIV